MTRRRPIDLATVHDARRRLAEIAREHPVAFDPERLPTTPEALVHDQATCCARGVSSGAW